jgi:hypothetical protein
MTFDGTLENIASDFADCLKVACVELDRSPNLGLWYGIRCIPTMLCFVNGEECVGIFGTSEQRSNSFSVETGDQFAVCARAWFARFNRRLTCNVDQNLFGQSLQSPIPALRFAEKNLESAVALGFGQENASALIKALEKEAGVEVKAGSAR